MSKTLRAIGYGSVMAAALAAAMPSYAQLTQEDRLGTSMGVSVPAMASASAGSSAVELRTVGMDRTVPDRSIVIYQGTGSHSVNVNWGDNVEFLVRQPGAPERMVRWHFNGLDNVMSFADIDSQAQFASDVKIYVNQSTRSLGGSRNWGG